MVYIKVVKMYLVFTDPEYTIIFQVTQQAPLFGLFQNFHSVIYVSIRMPCIQHMTYPVLGQLFHMA